MLMKQGNTSPAKSNSTTAAQRKRSQNFKVRRFQTFPTDEMTAFNFVRPISLQVDFTLTALLVGNGMFLGRSGVEEGGGGSRFVQDLR